jgi:hypothetical protein
MHFSSQDEQYRVLLKLSLIALYILMAFDLAVIIVGYLAIQSNFAETVSKASQVRNIILLIAFAEFIALHFVKKSMLKKTRERNPGDSAKPGILPYLDLLQITIVIAAMCSAISLYGLVLVLLGERFEMLMLFVVLSLIGYQFFRLRPRDFQENT